MKLRHLTRPLEIRAIEENGTFEGYGSVFHSVNSYRERVMPGAFAKSIKEHLSNKTMPAMLWQHNSDSPIGVWESMQEDKRGLKMTGRLLIDRSVPHADGAYALLKEGAVRGLSIGFDMPKGGYSENEKDGVLELSEINLWETSIVTFPAAKEAQVTDVRCSLDAGIYPTVREMEEWLMRDAGFTRKDAQIVINQGFKELVTRDADNELEAVIETLRGMRK